MSIEKRTLNVQREVMVVLCDGPDCDHSITHDDGDKSRYLRSEWERSNWWSVYRMNTDGSMGHFCSFTCLAQWAEKRMADYGDPPGA